MIRTVLKMGNPILKQVAIPVQNIDDKQLLDIVQEMIDTMEAKGGVGLAAPQIGYSLRLIIFGFEHNTRYPHEQPVPFTILVNPSYEALSDVKEEAWEGCLSIPGLRAAVPRFSHIKYRGYALDGRLIEREADGFHARIIQHEIDHLDGVLYPSRLKDMAKFGFEDEITD
ncbi:MAG: peptide deformylase [Gammaproteobacteria bacterium]|nr:peptide deformylase [Gammaproteobacteria bacterium]